ncbi:MAG: hypothetical protein MK132_21710 [Lentisphaerales bacterium]|nr:hypothetical protein [Lentisphaerales bacterium]
MTSCTFDTGQESKKDLKAVEEFSERVHEISIIHPGDPDAEVMTLDLMQGLDSASNPVQYSLWVNSVICRDKTCDVVLVKLIWDAFGRYKRYEVKKGFKLSKLDHVPFSTADHQKLQGILLNKKSALSEATKEGLVGPKSKGVDGVAGATVLTLGEHVVLGAGYTCYDLWHWANGEVCEIIQEKTSKQTSIQRLQKYLCSGDDVAIQTALQAFTQRGIYTEEVVGSTIAAMRNSHVDLMPLAIKYLQSADAAVPYEASFQSLLTQVSAAKVLLLIESFYEYEKPPLALVVEVSKHLNNFKNYQEIHRFLSYIESHQIITEEILENVSKLLEHPKFFFSRRAYNFLEEQQLPEDLKKKVKNYLEKYADRL